MMTDREMLELAAKAAGMTVKESRFYPREFVVEGPPGEWNVWRPHDDDGDAFRLAIKADLNVFQTAGSAYAVPSDDSGEYEQQVRYVDVDNDQCKATRLAIVRAAAEIGKAMK